MLPLEGVAVVGTRKGRGGAGLLNDLWGRDEARAAWVDGAGWAWPQAGWGRPLPPLFGVRGGAAATEAAAEEREAGPS